MFGQIFYNGTIRKYVIYFGTIFSDLWMQRDDSAGNIIQTFKVPINYGPKEKFLARLEGNPDLNRQIAIQLPRMTFEMSAFDYDPTRKLLSTNRQLTTSANGTPVFQYSPIPYNIGFDLNIMTKNAEDGTRIIEQILPFFTPDFTATLNINPELNEKLDIPIVLNNVSQTDTYEGSFEVRRALIWTLNFTMKAWLFGPTRTASDIIKHIDLNINIPPSNVSVQEANSINTANTSSIAIYPGMYPNNEAINWSGSSNAISHPSGYQDPYTINEDNNWGFIIDFSGE